MFLFKQLWDSLNWSSSGALEKYGNDFLNALNATTEQEAKIFEFYQDLNKIFKYSNQENLDLVEKLTIILQAKLTEHGDLGKFKDIFYNLNKNSYMNANVYILVINASLIVHCLDQSRAMLEKTSNYCDTILKDVLNDNNARWQDLVTLVSTASIDDIQGYSTRMTANSKSWSAQNITDFFNKIYQNLSSQKDINPKVLILFLSFGLHFSLLNENIKLTGFITTIINKLLDDNIEIPAAELHIISQLFTATDLQAILNTNNPLAAKILEQINEIKARKILGLAWSIKDTSTIKDYTFKLSGSFENIQIDFLKQTVSSLNSQQYNSMLNSIETPGLNLKDKETIAKSAHQLIQELSAYEPVPQDITKKTILKFVSAVEDGGGHAIAFGLFDNTFCYVNRGAGNLFSGIRIFKITDEDLAQIIKYTQDKHDINKIEEFLNSLQDPTTRIAMKVQKSGNCAFIACKTMYWFAMYIETLKYLEQHHKSISNKEEIAINLARQTYKYFSITARIYALDNYLKINSDLGKDDKLLTKVYLKLNNKSSQISDELKTDIINKIDLQTLEKLSHEFVEAILESMNRKFMNFYDHVKVNQICDLMHKMSIPISDSDKEALFLKALSNIVQVTQNSFMSYDNQGFTYDSTALRKLMEKILSKDFENFSSVEILAKLPKASKQFMASITDDTKPESQTNLAKFVELLPENISNYYLKDIPSSRKKMKL
jgi:hypothetical protein